MRGLMYLLELLGVAGIVGLIAFIPWTKMALGAVLAFLGAFFPTRNVAQAQGQGEVRWKQVIAKFSGGVRVGVVIAGMILLIGALLDGYQKKQAEEEMHKRTEFEEGVEQAMQRLRAVLGSRQKTSSSGALPKLLVPSESQTASSGALLKLLEEEAREREALEQVMQRLSRIRGDLGSRQKTYSSGELLKLLVPSEPQGTFHTGTESKPSKAPAQK
jgi:hypothetical protein